MTVIKKTAEFQSKVHPKPIESTKADKAAAELFEIYTTSGEKVCQTRFAEMQAGLKHFEAMILREKFYWLLKKAGKV